MSELEYATEVKLYGIWSLKDVEVKDVSLVDHIAVASKPVFVPHTSGRWQKRVFRKNKCPIVERLINQMMKHGRNSGKKL